MTDDVDIQRVVALDAGVVLGVIVAVRALFRDTASRWPDNAEAAKDFQDLWLEQYLRLEPDLVFVALSRHRVVGYLVGCAIDPARSTRFSSLEYFQVFAPWCAAYPAHFHINLAVDFRGRHIGERLVEAFCATLRVAGVGGVHVVTGAEQRNVSFYKRIGFSERGRTIRNAGSVVFLARDLTQDVPRPIR